MSSSLYRLRVAPAEGDDFDYPLDDDAVVVGRAVGARLILDDDRLAVEHSRIFRRGGRLWLEDLGTPGGTRLNGRVVRAAQPLRTGDVIELGASRLTVEHESLPLSGGDGRVGLGTPLFRSATQLLREDAEAADLADRTGLERRAERLQVLNEVHRALGQPMELGRLLELILDSVFTHLRPEQGAIFLRQAGGGHQTAAIRPAEIDTPEGQGLYSRSLQREVSDKGMAALVLDLAHDERFALSQSIQSIGIRSLVAAPLLGPGGSLGMIVLSSKAAERQFTEGDMELLVSLAAVAALSIRNVELAEELVERRRVDKELTLARRIQVALLPKELPQPEGWQLHAGNVPSRAVSGDYYLAVERENGAECVLMVADVSGKGIAASLLTASLEALAAGPIEDGMAAEQICTRLSRQLYARTPPERYATAFVAILQPASGRLRWANAGHVSAILIRRTGEHRLLAPTGPPLGLVADAEHQSGEDQLAPGDFLMMFTDGITETIGNDDRDYGPQRLVEVCSRHAELSLRELAREIERDLDRFAASGQPSGGDDRTFVMLRRDR